MKNLFSVLLLICGFILIACQPFAASSNSANTANDSTLADIWVIKKIGGDELVDDSQARIQFAVDGAIDGNAGCNRFFGKYRLSGDQLAIEPLGSTRMMCLPTLMLQEQHLLEHLPTATNVSIKNDTLILRNANNKIIVEAFRELP